MLQTAVLQRMHFFVCREPIPDLCVIAPWGTRNEQND